MISGAGRTPPIASPSTNWLSVSQWWPSTALSLQERDHGVGAAEGQQAGLQALEEDLAGERDGDRTGHDDERHRARARTSSRRRAQRAAVRPQLVGEPAAEQDEDEAGRREEGQREAATAISASGTSVMNDPPSRTSARATSAPTAAVSP